MSLAALLQATRDKLRSSLSIENASCECQDTGQPPPNVGPLYYAIHPLKWARTDSGEMVSGLDESYGVGVTITKRIAATPRDRVMSEFYLKSLQGFEALARMVMVNIHQRWDLIATANATILAVHTAANNNWTPDYFVEPLRWQETDHTPTDQTPLWFWSDGDPEYMATLAGQSLTITFDQARRPIAQAREE